MKNMLSTDKGCAWLTNGVHFRPSAEEDGYVTSCCRMTYRHKDLEEMLDKAVNDPTYSYENLKDTSCSRCRIAEESNVISLRQSGFGRWGVKYPPGKLVQIQAGFSSFCNLKCKYCGPAQSTSWNDDIEWAEENNIDLDFLENKEITLRKEDTFKFELKLIEELRNADLRWLTHVGVFGGEPFMTRNFETFIDMLAEKTKLSNLQIQINTNATIFPKQKIIDILCKFGKVDLRCSTEAVGNLAEYIRNGLNWNLFEKNTNKWMELSEQHTNIKTRVHATHTIWSINKVNEFDDWAKKSGYMGRVFDSWTYNPAIVNARQVLTEKQIEECKKIVESIYNVRTKDFICRQLNAKQVKMEEKHLLAFRKFTEVFDPRTKFTLKEVNPQLYSWTHN